MCIRDRREDPEARDAARTAMTRLLEDDRWRAELADGGRALVDGDGRVRVADAIEALVATH